MPQRLNPRRPPRSPTAKLSEADIREILTNPEKLNADQLAAKKLCDKRTIYRVWYGEAWAEVAPELPRRAMRAKARTTEDEIAKIRRLNRIHKEPAKVARMVGKTKTTTWRVATLRTHREIY